jgi:hypothetical protein
MIFLGGVRSTLVFERQLLATQKVSKNRKNAKKSVKYFSVAPAFSMATDSQANPLPGLIRAAPCRYKVNGQMLDYRSLSPVALRMRRQDRPHGAA